MAHILQVYLRLGKSLLNNDLLNSTCRLDKVSEIRASKNKCIFFVNFPKL